MILRPVSPAVALRTADHEAARGIDVIFRALVDPLPGQRRLNDLLHAPLRERLVLRQSLCWVEITTRDFHRLIVHVAHRHLALRVRAQPCHLAGSCALSPGASQQMREHDRRRHQFGRLIARIAEHQALVARALFAFVLAVHTLAMSGDCLPMMLMHAAAGAIEAHVGVVVADVQHGAADQLLQIDPG